MGLPDHILDQFARRVVSGTTDSSRTPRPQQMSFHLGQVAAVDPSTNTVHFSVNGSSLVIPNVGVMQTYGGLIQPAVGHNVWAIHNGTDLIVAGQNLLPVSSVLFP